PTVADAAFAVTGRNWAGFVTDRVTHFAAGHYDVGQTVWEAPWRDERPWEAWRRKGSLDMTGIASGVEGMRRLAESLPDTAEKAVPILAERLGLTEEALVPTFHRLLMSMGGWAAHARRIDWELIRDGGTPVFEGGDEVLDLLAVRLAWDVALLDGLPEAAGVKAAWTAARDGWTAPEAAVEDISVDSALQTALDAAARRELAIRFAERAPADEAPARPDVQMAFCIDVRSEVFRRALEGTGPGVQTLGFAGFFGFSIEQVAPGEAAGGARCPVLLTPGATVKQSLGDAAADVALEGRIDLATRVARAWAGFRRAAVSSFAFVEAMGLTYSVKLVKDSLGLTKAKVRPGVAEDEAKRLAPSLTPTEIDGRAAGIDADGRLALAEGALRGMSLTTGHARLVVLAGHGSSNVNNPHAAGLDCGACGGHSGEANAEVAALVLNDADVRRGLAEKGIEIPEDTFFVGALHDTTTDEVTLFDAHAPASHVEDLKALRKRLAGAGRAAREERLPKLPRARRQGDVLARARDWSETRPEWGLAGCAAFIAAPRGRTSGIDLGGRAFLHDYDWAADAEFGVLELIMTAPMIVASWISLQYYGSAVDPKVFGAGDKTLHNVVAGFGVLEGAGGDLRVGLPLQSFHDGEALRHEPLRLTVVIEAPEEAMTALIDKHQAVRDLLDNGWLTLVRMDGEGRLAQRYVGGLQWAEMAAGADVERAA
ncbi:MAG: DUF2309 domain-containing protein, partial [Pseudomonadota bacterium]